MYQDIYKRSIEDPENFWAEQAEKYLSWQQKWDHVLQGNFKDLNVRWFITADAGVRGGKTSALKNNVDEIKEFCMARVATFYSAR